MNRTAAIVVTYNRFTLLKECVSSLLNQVGTSCDVLVIDNGSSDGTRDYLRSLSWSCTNVSPIFMKKNEGGDGGFYYGLKEAYHRGYDFFWMMDDDTIPSLNALQVFLHANDYLGGGSHYGWLSSAAFWVDGTECRMNRQKIKKDYYNHLEEASEGLFQALQATFVSLFVPRETIYKAGLPIKEYFIWGDDIEFTRRIAVRMQMPCWFVPGSRVTHKMKNNSGSSIAYDSIERIDRYVYAFRNDFSTYQREGIKGDFYYFAKCGKNLLLILLFSKDHKGERIKTMLKGFAKGITFHPGEEKA